MTKEVVAKALTEVFVVFKVSEQVSGGHVAIQALKAFTSMGEAEKFTAEQKSGRQDIMIEGIGNTECDVQLGIHPVDLE